MFGQDYIGKRQDRLLAFFDAVMAIAMTVLALEITVPRLSTISCGDKYTFFVEVTCYFISFVAMSTLWYIHNNFFSIHDLTGKNIEIVLHLVLLFVITLFQPLTRAIGQHPDDFWIRVFYLADFFIMYGLAAAIMFIIRRREGKINERKATGVSFIKAQKEKFPLNEEDLSDEAKDLHRLLKLAYIIRDPEIIHGKMAEYMPEEYRQEVAELKKKREESYRISICSVFAMAAAVLAAVVLLIFSLWWAYIALAGGLAAIFLIRIFDKVR